MLTSLSISLISAISLIAATAAQLLLARKLGIGSHSDALFLAQAIPQFVLTVGNNVIYFSLVPVLSKLDPSELHRTSRRLYVLFFLILLIVAVLLGLTAPLWFWILFSPAQAPAPDRVLGSFLWFAAMLPFAALAISTTAVLIAQGKVIRSALVPLIGNLFLAAAFWSDLVPRYSLSAVSEVYVLSHLVQSLFGFALSKTCPTFSWRDLRELGGDLMKLRTRSGSILISQLISKSGEMLDRAFGSRLAMGSLSQIIYAYKLATPISTVLSSGISTQSFVHFSKNSSSQTLHHLPHLLFRQLRNALVLLAVFIPLFWIASEPLVSRIFNTILGVASENVAEIATQFRIYLIWILFVVLGDITSRAIYAIGLGRALILLSVLDLVIGLTCRYFFIDKFQAQGIPLAAIAVFSISLLAQSAILIRFFRRHSRNSLIQGEPGINPL